MSAAIPSQMTNDMRERLRGLGLTEEQIKNLTPPEAHGLLNSPPVPTLLRDTWGYPENADAPDVPYLPLSAALSGTFPDDRHFAAYSLPSVPKRLATDDALKLAPRMVCFVVDVDGPKGVESWWSEESAKISDVLDDHPGGFCYRTKNGYRVVWLIPPFTIASRADKESWKATYLAWLDHLADTYDVHGDRLCCDWTRLFRLPYVVRDGVEQKPETIGDPNVVGTWTRPTVTATERPKPETPTTVGEKIPSGQRNSTLMSMAGTMRNRGMSQAAILAALEVENEEKCDSPLPDSELQSIAASVMRYPPGADAVEQAQTLQTLQQIAARDADWAAELEQARADLDAYRGMSVGGGGKHASPAFEPLGELFKRPSVPTPWLVEKLVTEASFGITGAEPKSTKTWSELEIHTAIATGTPAFGVFKTGAPRSVGIFLAEDPDRAAKNRLRALAASRGLKDSDLARIYVACRKHLDITRDEDLIWILASARRIPDLASIMIDPLRNIHGAEENDSTGMSDVMRRLQALRDILGCAVRVPHHAKKGASSGRGGQDMRGSSAIHGAIDCGLFLSDLKTDGRSYWETKASVELKAAQGAGLFSLRLDVEDNSFGEAVCARWTVTRENVASTVAEDLEEKISDVVRVLATAVAPMGTDDVVRKARGSKKTVRAALEKAMKRGLVHQDRKGRRVNGWLITQSGRRWANGDAPECGHTVPQSDCVTCRRLSL